MKKQFLILFAFISVLALSQVPQRFNKVIVTGDITSPKFIKTGSNADSVLLGNGSARSVNSLKTDTVSLSNRINAKATGNGTANGVNTGDETLTSIKTKLGAATSVSDGYLKYQDWNMFNNKVSNATHTGDVTGSTALTLKTVNSNVGTFNNVTINAKGLATAGSNVSYEPSFSKNTAFNKNFGTTPGTVLEGDGTAANSTLWNSQGYTNSPQPADYIMATDGNGTWGYITKPNFKSSLGFGTAANSAVGDFQPAVTGLATNYMVRWNGSIFDNSLISDNGASITLNGFVSGTNGLRLERSGHNSFQLGIDGLGLFMYDLSRSKYLINFSESDGHVSIPTTTPSTSPTTGALVVGGGVGADHVRANNFYGNGSNLTGIQLPITLTTNGTSGAATFSGNVLNVPNYGNGATSGTYVPALTNYSNIASSSAFEAMYMHIGNMYSLSIKAAITPSTAGSCTLRITLPQQSNNKTGVFSVTSISNDQSTVLPSFTYTVGGADYVGVVVNVPSTDPITLTVTGMYTHQ